MAEPVTDPDFKPGDRVVAWRGEMDDVPGHESVIARVTKTQVITDHGARWSRTTLRRVGDHGYRSPTLYHADDPRIAEAARGRDAKARRAKAAGALESAASWWVNHPDEKRTTALRTAILAVAPLIGLTVTVNADQCAYKDDGRPCLLDGGHAETGQWHAGLGWTASLGRTPREA